MAVLLTSIVARRCTGSAFAPTRYPIDPLPWPVGSLVRVTHGASLDAVHVQSRVVVTATLLVIPAAGADPESELAALT